MQNDVAVILGDVISDLVGGSQTDEAYYILDGTMVLQIAFEDTRALEMFR